MVTSRTTVADDSGYIREDSGVPQLSRQGHN